MSKQCEKAVTITVKRSSVKQVEKKISSLRNENKLLENPVEEPMRTRT